MAYILAIDDETEILKVIKRALEKAGHQVMTVSDPYQIRGMNLVQYEMILLDVMMPGIDGFALCKEIREQVDCPILFLTAKTMEDSVVYGFSVGGDDYIKKPFSIAELRARVDAHLRRDHRKKVHGFQMSGLQFRLLSKEVYKEEKKVPFTKSEYEIAEFLATNHGQVFSREQIFEKVFGWDKESDSSVITEHVKNIRNKLSTVGVEPIKTVWGIGYQWMD